MFLAKKYTVTEYIRYNGLLNIFRDSLLNKEAMIVLSYFTIYMIYSFLWPEADYLHWITLVLLPFGILYFIQKRSLISPSFRLSLAFFGLRKNNLLNGVFTASLLGISISFFQVVAGGDVRTILGLFSSGEFIYLLPVAFILIVITVGFAEEFFFRGVIQTRISRLVNSNFWGITITAFLFGMYRIPYYYLAVGDFSLNSSGPYLFFVISEGFFAGSLLGYTYLKSNENLLSCVILHSTILILPMIETIKASWF